MKKLYTLLLLLVALHGPGQSYNNEWIKFNQTYYKFKVANEGVTRISKATLDAAGLGNTAVQYFELWRNGQPVPFYPSVPNGLLPATGYLEFYAEPNDGAPDRALYFDPAFQHTDRYNLITDTVVYFLSVNTDGSGPRYQPVVNNLSGPLPPLEAWFTYTYGNYFKKIQNQGWASVLNEYLYSSAYDRGEYWSSDPIAPGSDLVEKVNNLHVFPGGPDATMRFGASGNALNSRNIKVTVNNSLVKDETMNYFYDLHTSVPLSNDLIKSGTFDVVFGNTSAASKDRMVVSYFEISYPRLFKFGGVKNFKFKLPAKAAGYHLEIKEFDYGSTPPVLYDRASRERFVGNLTARPGYISFALPGLAKARDLVLVNAEAGNVRMVNELVSKTFTDFSQAAKHGNYLIIAHPSLYQGSAGNNPVLDYKAYRESVQGGGYTVLVAEIDELVDQFAFGIKKHPLSVRNFIRYERDKFSRELKYVLLMGRGMHYVHYQKNITDPITDKLNLVPTFGYPASDNLMSTLTTSSTIPVTPIGRLSVVHAGEIEDYLVKVKEYENAQQNAPNTIAGRAWMKNMVQVTGISDAYHGTVVCNYMGMYKQMSEGPSYGGKVATFCKTSSNTSDQFVSDQISKLFNEGLSVLNYFGHSSATTLEFNLDNPQNYNNQGKYPVFLVNGCNAGNFFTFYRQRFTSNETLSEKFVLAKQRGSIAFVASTHFGEINTLNSYLIRLYQEMTAGNANKSLGETTLDAFQRMLDGGATGYMSRIHMEQITIHGDPAIRINGQAKPDYVVEESLIRVNPSFVSIAETHFQMKVGFMNLGKATDEPIVVQVKQQYPDGATAVVYREKIAGIPHSDSVIINIPIVATRDKGRHILTVTIDEEGTIDEVSEGNNTAVKEINIFQDEARPAYPYHLSIIKEPTQKLYATTADPFSVLKDYVVEIDTTADFNSLTKKSRVVSSSGGIIEYDPGLTYKDSTVYYWRISPVPVNGGAYQWFNQSFAFMKEVEGYNQSHFFQHEQSGGERMYLDASIREWKYGKRKNKIRIKNCIWGGNCDTEDELELSVNEVDLIASACVSNTLVFHVFDSVTFKPWMNVAVDAGGVATSLNRYGSANAHCGKNRWYNFEFQYGTPESRKLMMDFMDSIPPGSFVVVRSIDQHNPTSYSQTWRNDTILYGSNRSLYHKLLEAGFMGIDSLYKSVPWAFVYKKGDNATFVPKWDVGKDNTSRVNLTVECYTPDTLGYINSPIFGPAAAWTEVDWNGRSLETPSTDQPTIDVIGITKTFSEQKLFTLSKGDVHVDLRTVDAKTYPFMRLRMRNVDSIHLTPFQLDYWRVFYKPLPEGALAANLHFEGKDSLETGEALKFRIAYKNLSHYDFDSVKIKVVITDHNNVPDVIPYARQKALVSGDTIQLRLDIPTQEYVGTNTLYIEVNPGNDQFEQYHFNNFLYRNFYVKPDNTNPFLDVTFDGVHILNRDIVSARPHIQIRLKDDAKHLLLSDTSLLTLEVKYPNGTMREFKVDNDTLRFTPATSGKDNSAVLDFTPAFTHQVNPEGDEYELLVRGRDESGNKAGRDYRVAFKVINKAMISNLLNYPNPFSTSTAFVFTLTGSELPQNLKVQILTVTGKIVREITMAELGPVHIGRNITEFKWDGTDQYGQKLANGVYLYRVVTTLNGKSLDKYKADNDNTAQYFNNGYGKMYLMR